MQKIYQQIYNKPRGGPITSAMANSLASADSLNVTAINLVCINQQL